MDKIEHIILSSLIFNENFSRKAIPFIKESYFSEISEKTIFQEIKHHIDNYNNLPTKSIILIEAEKRKDLNEELFKSLRDLVNSFTDTSYNYDWLLDSTEKWCKDKAIYNALLESIKIADNNDENLNRDSIPDILSKALAVSFDEYVGHDYLDDASSRYESYHKKEDRIPFDLEMFNKITDGGLPNKTLSICLAGTNTGKSLFMCHMAASCLVQNKNVLYITLEMAEEQLAKRIDANLLNVTYSDIKDIPKEVYESKILSISKKTQGKLIFKEYPTSSAHVGHFKSLLNELQLKKNFKPDIIFIDYLNICASSRFKGSIVNSYTYIKAIAEEIRGLAVEQNVPIFSATQTTRSGFNNSDVEITDTSESFGLPATADFMFALISTEELERMNQIMVKQLKNRYSNMSVNKRFVVGVDKSKMKFYDVDNSQEDIIDSGKEENDNLVSMTDKMKSKFAQFNF